MRGIYNPNTQFRGLTHDRYSKSLYRMAGLDPQERNAAALKAVARRVNRRNRRDNLITAILALVWLAAVIAATA